MWYTTQAQLCSVVSVHSAQNNSCLCLVRLEILGPLGSAQFSPLSSSANIWPMGHTINLLGHSNPGHLVLHFFLVCLK